VSTGARHNITMSGGGGHFITTHEYTTLTQTQRPRLQKSRAHAYETHKPACEQWGFGGQIVVRV